MKNVLVFPCGSEIGLEIYKSLAFSTHFNVFGGSSVDDHGKFVYKNYIGNIPMVTDSDFIKKINNIVNKYKIDFIFPAHDSVVLKLARERESGNLACEVITSPLKTCELVRSKSKTYNFFQKIIPTPKIFQNVNKLKPSDFPIFLKPDIGQGSKGTFLASDIKEVETKIKKDKTLLILEYLPGKEYTIDCFTDQNGKLLLSEGRERKRILNGISVNSFSVDDERFRDLAEKINHNINLRGAWFFQVKENTLKELVLMEIAPRIAGTMGLIRCKGVNLVLLSLFDRLNYETNILMNKYALTIDRALHNSYKHNIRYRHVYLDLDDLVIFKRKVNSNVMAFVYQCINNGVKIHLITKHHDNLNSTLKKYRLNNIFDELILIKDTEEKHSHIKEKNAIFIDDSFAERKKVSEICKIPVFDSHMIECLIENV